MDSAKFWQNPFVNVGKTYKIVPESGAPGSVKSSKRALAIGDVKEDTCQDIRSSIWRLQGAIPANNYIQFPAESRKSLNLIGCYCYIAFRPAPSKYFVFHLDLCNDENVVFHVSFSNMFKISKVTTTQAQFPFHVAPSPKSVDGAAGSKGTPGAAPKSVRWTMFIIDLKRIMKIYFNSRYSYLKTIKICSNCFLKGAYTSSIHYDPSVSIVEARKLGIKKVSENLSPMPREINFVIKRDEPWLSKYELVQFPVDTDDVPIDVAQKSSKCLKELQLARSRPITKTIKTSTDKVIKNNIKLINTDESLHMLAEVKHVITGAEHIQGHNLQDSIEETVLLKEPITVKPNMLHEEKQKDKLFLTMGCAINLTSPACRISEDEIVFGSGLILVVLNTKSLLQTLLTGHNQHIVCVGYLDSGYIISAQSDGIVRIWHDNKGIILLKTTVSTNVIRTRRNRFFLVGKCLQTSSNMSTVSVWDLHEKTKVVEITRGSTDQEISALALSPNSNVKFCTGGVKGLKFWRVKNTNHLRSAAIDFGKYSNVSIVSVQWGHDVVVAAGHNGTIFKIDPDRLIILDVHQLTIAAKPIFVTQILLIDDMLLVASQDFVIRFWTMTLTKVLFQLELEGAVKGVCDYDNCCLITTNSKSIGWLDLSTKRYTTYFRAHRKTIEKCCFSEELLCTISNREELRVWKIREVNLFELQKYSIVQVFQHQPENEITAVALNKRTIVIGLDNGVIEVYELEKDSCEKVVEINLHKQSILDLHFSPLGQLYSIDCAGEIICFDTTFKLSRMLRDGSSIALNNKIKSSPEGRFVIVLAYMSACTLQIYSSQLDPLTQVKPPDTQLISDWYFLNASHLMVIKSNQKAIVCNIAEEKYALCQAELHSTNDLIHAGYSIKNKLHVTGSRDSLKVWPNSFNKKYFQEYIGHKHISQIVVNNEMLFTVGDTAILWNFCGLRGLSDIRRQQTTNVIKYSEQPLQVEANMDITISMQKKSLFSDLVSESEEDPSSDVSLSECEQIHKTEKNASNNYLLVTEETADNLNITPVLCSSPIEEILPEAFLECEKSKDSVQFQQDHSVRILKHVSSDEPEVSAKPVIFPPGHYLYVPPNVTLPQNISPAKSDEEAFRLLRSISFGCSGSHSIIWASKRGELVYASGTVLVIEQLETSRQEFITSSLSYAEITTVSMSIDELHLAIFYAHENNELYASIINCETRKIKNITICHKDIVFLSHWSKDSRHLLTISGTYQSFVQINSTWDGEVKVKYELTSVINDARWINEHEFITVGHEIIKWEMVQVGSGKIELRNQQIMLDNKFSNEMFACMDVCDAQMACGTSSGTCILFELDSTNFEFEYSFPASDAEISAVAVTVEGGIITSSETSVKVWQLDSGDLLKTRRFKVVEEFELDGPVVSMFADGEIAVVATFAGSVLFLSNDNLSTLVPSSSGLTDLAEHSDRVVTCHLSGSVKLWQKSNNKCWSVSLQFQTTQVALCCTFKHDTIAAGYEGGVIRIFSITESVLKLKIETKVDEIVNIQLTPGGVLTGTSCGKVFLHSLENGALLKQFNDHFESCITMIDYDSTICHSSKLTLGGHLWLISSEDRRISIWTSKWSNKDHHLAAWISFPGSSNSTAKFSRTNPDQVIYWTSNHFYIYSLEQQSTIIRVELPHQVTAFAVHSIENLFLFASGRLLTVAELSENMFIYQDYPLHTRNVESIHFCSDNHILTATREQFFHWKLL